MLYMHILKQGSVVLFCYEIIHVDHAVNRLGYTM